MIRYGFNFESLYCLDLKDLLDVCRIIRDSDAMIAPDKDVIIRGCIIPFLRNAAKALESACKDEVMRLALITVAKKIGVSFKNWNDVETDSIASATRRRIQGLLAERLDELAPKDQEKILGIARNSLAESAKIVGAPLTGAGALLAGEMSGFGIYLATTTGLHALSLALGTTFSWGVYQGATTLLGIVLGPIGWAVAGLGVAGSTIVAIRNWAASKQEQKLVLVVAALLIRIGESPFQFSGVASDATLDDLKGVDRAIAKTLHPDILDPNLPQWILEDFANKWFRYQEAREKLERIKRECKDE